MINQILQDSQSIPHNEYYHFTHMGEKDIERYVLETRRKKNLKKIKIITLYNLNFHKFYEQADKKAVAVFNRKLRSVKDKYFWILFWKQILPESFIREYADKLNWTWVSWKQNLSENLIRDFAHKVNWYNICANQNLSESFILEFKERICWKRLYVNKKLSSKFIIKHMQFLFT